MSMEMNKALDLLREIRPSIPKEVLELWCKDRDAFLASHPAVEQAGGDERAAFEVWIHTFDLPPQLDGEIFADERYPEADCFGQFVYDDHSTQRCWAAWQARAALAHPSPTTDSRPAEWSSYDPTWVVDFIRNNSIFNADLIERMLEYATRPAGDVPQAEQAEAEAEAERPEVVASVVHSNPVVLGQCGPLNANDELMTVAQHAASVARWAEMFNRVEQERDAALARVAELEACGAPALLAAADYFAERAKGPSPGWVTLSAVAKELRVRADKAPVAQAQHSVPDGVTVNPEALRQVVRALVGPAHHIRELQVTASLPGSPITELVKQYNAWAAAAPGKEGV